MSPIDWAIRPMKKYATFSGRAPRAEFWWFFLALMIFYFIVSFVFGASIAGLAASQSEPSAGMMGAMGVGSIVLVLFWLAVLIPTIAVQVRRLHDTNRSGWWLGGFYLLYAIYFVMLMSVMGSTFGAAMTGSASPPAAPQAGGMLVMSMILGFVMMIYGIALIVFYCLPGTKGQNKYGDDPYGANVEEVFA